MCLSIDQESCRNVVRVLVDLLGVDPIATLTILRRISLSITEQTHEKLASVC